MLNKAIDLLYRAKQYKIEIVLNEEKLQLKVPKNTAIDQNLLQEIKDNKEIIIDFLKNNSRNTKSDNTITRADRDAISSIPLSFSQQRLWFIDRMEGSVQYHMPTMLRLKGKLNKDALENAFENIIGRHEILRTVFVEEKGNGYQFIKDKQGWSLAELNGAAYQQDRYALEQCIDGLIKQPFDLSNDYMLRAHLIHLDEEDHVLAVTIHHIASDGWSLSVLVKEVVELYSAYDENRPPQLPPLQIQYADYAIWQQRFLAGELFDRKLAYWKAKLDGVATLQLPMDFARPAVQSTKGAVVKHHIDKWLAAQLQELSQQQGCTLFMTLLAAFKVLLSRYSGQQDICVGTPIAGRQQQELEELIGFFVNTLALRTEVNGNATFQDLLQQVRMVTMEAYENQEVPFEKIVDEVVKERSLSRNPLFQVMMVFMNTPEVPELFFGKIKLSKENFEHSSAKFDIQIFITETPDGLSIATEYCTDLFTSDTIYRMMLHFENLLMAVVKDPMQKISNLSMLTKAEEQRLLVELNNTRKDYPKDKNVIALFEEQVLKTPSALAVIFEDKQFTYHELNSLANQLAHYLISIGVKEETLVPICLDRSPQMIVAIWGILKAGAAYTPIDPAYPEERIRYMLEDTAASIIITSTESRDKIPATEKLNIIELDNLFTLINNQPAVNLNLAIRPHHLAYIIYTSGSTGKPKGAMNEHGALANRLFWAQDYFNLTYQDVVLQKTTFCFDVSVWELVWPLLVGAKLVFAKPGGQKDNGYLKSVIEKNKISVLHFVPSMLSAFLPDLQEGDCPALKKVLCSGEALTISQVELLKKKLPLVELHNLYGPTEAAIDVTCWSLENNGRNISIIPIGKPIANTTIYILDEHHCLSPLGGIGEIHIGGIQVARGYLNRAELTAQKFIKDPFSNIANARLYKTGDLGRWMPDGNIEYLGRKDDQVKIRGYRIELGEVEAVINELPMVSGNCVVVKKHAGDTDTLVSYFIPGNDFIKEKEQQLYQAQVLNWKQLYEIEYEQTEADENIDAEFNIVSWNDSFTGEAIPAEVMGEWVKEIVDKILAQHPENVLEIGCGTGLVYYPLAGKVKKYIGTDFSASSIKQITQRINKGLRDYGPTELYVSAAHEVTLKPGDIVDTIILNSIVQYFPGEAYLNEVIKNSIEILNGSGQIIIGDVRDIRLLGLFKGRLQLKKMQQSVNTREFKWAVEQDILKEEELCISPAYFYRLQSLYPSITQVDIQWKKASYINELSLYRYAVIIYVGVEKPLLQPVWHSLANHSDTKSVLEQIENGVGIIALKDIDNPRLWKERQLQRAMDDKTVSTISDLLVMIENEDKENIIIRELIDLAATKGYQYKLFPAGDPLKVNVLLELTPTNGFIEQEYDANVPAANTMLTNHPLFTDISFLLQKEIQALLKQRLPEYMVPSEMIALTHLPLSNNGKTDRKFLSEREDITVTNKFNYQPPVTKLQTQLALIWQDLLHVERVGIRDDFFELGGHSLMVIRLISAVRKELNVELAIKDIFVYSNIAELSDYMETNQNPAWVLPPIEVLPRPQHIPLSFSQERLWFVDRLEGSVAFHIPAVLKLTGKLNKEALAFALQTIADRHEVLRTVFLEEEGIPYQFIKEKGGWNLNFTDGSAFSNNEDALKKFIKDILIAPFDLTKDHTLRAGLIVLGETEHVLVVTLHHIAADAWSLSILVKEVVELYKATVENRQVSLPTLAIQYADYAIWQRNYLSGEQLTDHLDYWKEKLNGLEPLQLPVDFQRPYLQSTKGKSTGFKIDQQLAGQLKELSQQQGATLFMALLAAFKILLHRYSGQQDICVGTSVAGRQQQETEGLIGFFVNMLALRTEVDPEISFNSLLQNVRQTTLDAYAHQDLPFEKVVDAVVKERDISRSPLFQVLFVMLNTPAAPETSLGDVTLSGMGHESASSKFDLTFLVTETANGITGTVEFCTELFEEQTILRMIAHFKELLQSIVTNAAKNIAGLRMITSDEEYQLIHAFNNNKSAYPQDKTIIEIFEEQAAASPDTIALVFENEQLTYRQLNERANQLGYYLQSKGVKENSLVAISMERSVEMMVGILGILKAGGAYIPIDPEYPAERIGFMLEDTGSPIIITSKSVRSKLPVTDNIKIIEIDGDWPLINKGSTGNLSSLVRPQNLAYIIYTSGSTGKPKGVMVTHNNVVSLVKGVDYLSLTSKDVLLSTGSSSFDATTLEYWGMLLNGGRLVFCSENRLLDNQLLKEEINARGINRMWFTSSWFNQLVESDITLFENLETILVGGEKLSPRHIEKLRQTYPGIDIINGYGPTENTTFSLTYHITETDINKPIPIGHPLNNRSAFILDENQQLVPVGVSGEICLGGAGLSKGYLNRPELTAEKFKQGPFNERMYRTGDIGRWLADGNIEYLGRKDEQVKIRGFRIELGEIENVLQECGAVKQAAVMVKVDKEGTKRLVAYVVPNSEYDKQAIFSFLKNKLPEYMIPAVLVEMEQLPLTHNGKTDRRALPDPDAAELADNTYTPPTNEDEKALVKIWEQLLDIDKVGIHDNFFEIGGDSLLAIRVVSAIRKALKIEMPVSDLFEYQTVASLAARLQTQSGAVLLPAIQPAQRPGHIPLSFSQERLWFIDRLEGTLQYHIPAVLRLKGDLNRNALELALRAVINRHEVLRTIFLEQDGDAYQFIKDKADWKLPVMDGSAYTNDLPGLQLLVQQLISSPFDLSKDNMLRAALVTLTEQEHLLVVTLHHIASDGWSRSILVKEVVALYAAYAEGREASLAVLPIQYADFAIWQRNYLQGEVLDNKMGYWQQKLQGVEPLRMPTDFPRPAIQTTRGGSKGFSFDAAIASALQKLSRQQGSTLFMTLAAALKVLLYRYSGQIDICVGTGIAGRQQVETEGLIGFFVNTLALRTEFSKEDSFIDLLQKVRKTTIEAYENQEIPFEKVVDVVIKKRDRGRNPIFQVMFVLQNTPEVPALELGGLQLSIEAHEHTTAQFDLSFSITEYANGLAGSVEYNTDLYQAATIEHLLAHFKQLIISVIAEPEKKIGELGILSKAEEQHLLFGLNANETPYPKDKTIVALFEEQVAADPEAIAVVFGDEQLTYRQLNESANQLARYLQSKGVVDETPVAISMERSLDMMLGILAILKAGGAYVPIDAGYPAERILFMLEDTAAGIVLATSGIGSRLPAGDAFEIICLDGNWMEEGITLPNAELQTNINPGSLAYIMYTSGSSGKPKGVMVTHQNVVSLVKGTGYVSLTQKDVLLSTGSPSFDATTLEYWGMLLNGGQLVLCGETTLQDSILLKAEIDKRKVNRMWFTSSWFNQLVETHIAVFENLDTILVGGEKLSEHHIEKCRQTYPRIVIINGYGPTENTTFSLTYAITETAINKPIPIGRPLNNRGAFILDENHQLVPVGVSGEICLSGAGLSKGYLNRPELTAEKFVQHPFIESTQAKMYKTGDMGRWLPDGNIEYMGRIDEQVKIRGYRIELAEIETVLQETNLISQAVVLACSDNNGSKYLVGYIVPSDLYNKKALSAWLQTKLPEYMIPAVWVEMERLPLTSNGKIDKRALPSPDASEIFNDQYVAPENEIEKKLVMIWQGILRAETIGTHDNFFELGGHSLLAMRLISALRKELKAELSVKELFEYPTVAELAGHLLQQKKVSSLPPIEANPRPLHIPLSFSQERLWFIDQLEGSVPYNSPTVLRLKGKLNTGALTFALQNIIGRHEVLRTVFHEAEGRPFQSITSQENWRLTFTEGSHYNQNPAGLQSHIEKLILAPFDLSKDYMLRADLVRLHEADHVLVVTIHHIATDAWSLPIIVKEVVELYSACEEDRQPVLDPLPLQFADYAIWQRNYLQGVVLDKKISYWKNKLEGLTALSLPTDFERPAIRGVRGATINFKIEKELSGQLEQLSRQQDTTLFMTLLATFKVLLHRYSGEQDICVGASIANRPQQELESLVGFFVNTLALRTVVDETASFTTLLQQVKTTTLEAYENQDLPFEKVVEEMVKERDPSRTPLFQVMLVLLNTPESSTLGAGELTLSNEPFEIKISKFELTFHVSPSATGLHVNIVYNTDLFREDTILRMAGHFQQLLSAVVDAPYQTIDSLQMLTEAEEQQLLVEFN